jgi:predicted enzyme related to lactoylglutathione lyase
VLPRAGLGYRETVPDVVWWEIETPAPERFQEFHGALWGWTFQLAFAGTDLGADYWIIGSGGTSLGGLQRAASPAEPHPGTRLYLEVADLEATVREAVRLGGQVERGRTALGGADRWFAVVRDPSGVSFGLWTPNPGQAGA